MDIFSRFRIWYKAQPRALRLLLTINVVTYLLWQIVLVHIDVTRSIVTDYLALHSAWPGILFMPWQLVTYNFLHLDQGLGGFIHILFNMLWLVWIGRDYEYTHGAHRLMAIYLLAGVGGGLLTVLVDVVSPATYLVHGASASVLGVVTAVAVLYPRRVINLLFIGNIRLVYLVVAFLVIDLLLLAGSNTAVAAHFGGAITGFVYARAEMRGVDLASWAKILVGERHMRSRTGTGEPSSVLGQLEAWLAGRNKKEPARITRLHPRQELGSEPIESPEAEVDRILDKISEEGYESLTEEEKRVLYEASRK